MGIEERCYAPAITTAEISAFRELRNNPKHYGRYYGKLRSLKLRVDDRTVALFNSIYKETERAVKLQKRHPL
ncbi:MAG: hypothetical protein AABW88_01085 [Nanoarchaeota archaeon]